MTIYLCRHGQTTGDIEDRYGGDYDDHLADLGKDQAKELAGKLAEKGIQKIFSSSRIRAVETANILKGVLDCEVEILDNLRERNQYGILTGMVKSEAKEKYPDLPEKLKDYRNTIEGAEDYESFQNRVNESMKQVTHSNFETVAVVTHGGPIKAILRQIEYAFDFKLEDCSFTELESAGDNLKIISLNGISPKG